jgi:hypothetical protein
MLSLLLQLVLPTQVKLVQHQLQLKQLLLLVELR